MFGLSFSNASAGSVGSLIVSCLVLIVVAFAENPTVAAIAASAPTGIPLALWIVASQEGHESAQAEAMLTFLKSAFTGVASTGCFVAAAYASVRFGITLRVFPTVCIGLIGWYAATKTLVSAS